MVIGQRSSRRVGSRVDGDRPWRRKVLVVGVLTLVVACQRAPERSGSPSVPGDAVGVSDSASPTGTAAVPHGIPDSAFANQKPFTGPAVAKYGQASLQAAYREMVDFAFASGWNSNLIARDSASLSRADAAFTTSYLTPAFKKEFLAELGLAVQGDKGAARKIEEAMFFGVTGSNGLRAVQSGKVVTNRRFSSGAVGVDTADHGRLSVSFAARGDIQMVDTAGRHMMLRGSRVLRYLLVANNGADRSSRPFLIDSWSIKMTVNPPIPVA